MTTYRYPYSRISRPSAQPLLQFKNQPLLNAGLANNSGQFIKIITYIDTGSQWCLFSNQYASQSGIKDYRKLKRKNAIEIQTKIGFVEKDFGFGGILGVYGFLDRFTFIGNIPESYFELKQMYD